MHTHTPALDDREHTWTAPLIGSVGAIIVAIALLRDIDALPGLALPLNTVAGLASYESSGTTEITVRQLYYTCSSACGACVVNTEVLKS